MRQQFRREVTELFKVCDQNPGAFVTETDLAALPAAIQRYLRYSNIIGTKRVKTVRLKQKGFMRMKEGGNWIPLSAEEYYSVDPPAFIWYGYGKVNPLLTFQARDRYINNRGHMLVKLLSIIKVADASGTKVDQGALMRYFSEIIWFPTSFLSENIHWHDIDSRKARGTFTYSGREVSAEFHVNEAGQLTNFVAERYRSVGKDFVLDKWSTPISEYAELNGIMVPVMGEAVWHLKSGDFSYIKIRITDLEYDAPVGYWLN
jgi:hypothetical protein